MKIFTKIESLKAEYKEQIFIRKNRTILLKPDKIPRCRHMLFSPLDKKTIKEFLIEEYKNKFPKEYADFLQYSNGANLFAVKLNYEKFSLGHSLFNIFGLPMTPPFEREPDCEEPFDVRIEDLARHKKLSKLWLKCGTYIKDYNFSVQNDIFIDTETNKVYACEKNDYKIIDSWDTLDECFCDIFDSFSECLYEYDRSIR